ncbi:MAG: hypothetical protein IJN67_10800 [Oscillospiraceae bacterium]|nr:hypothetical protein [Oscillospiraceae bacterium]
MAADKTKSLIMARRLKDLRTEKGLSHESLRKSLMEKYKIDISVDSLKNYEVSKVPHVKAYKNEGMRVEYLRCLADFYGVSADYILGLINDPCRVPSAIDDLGLSEGAVKWLSKVQEYKSNTVGLHINTVFENPYFQSLVFCIERYIDIAHAEIVYLKIYEQLTEKTSAYSHEEFLVKLESAISEIIESRQYNARINKYLQSNVHLWHLDIDSIGDAIMPVSGITDVNGYAISKSLVNLLDNLRKTVKDEVNSEFAANAEG